MAQVIMLGPPAHTRWCPVCLMAAKQKQWEMFTDEIQAGYAAPADGRPVVLAWPEALTRELFEGEYQAVSADVSMLGLIDGLCWNHVAGINPTSAEVSALDTTTRIPPGLMGKGTR